MSKGCKYILVLIDAATRFCWLQAMSEITAVGVAQVTRSYDLVVGTFDVFWDLFQVLFSGFILGSEGWGV